MHNSSDPTVNLGTGQAQDLPAPHVAEQRPVHESVLAAPLMETWLPGQVGASAWVRQHGDRLVAVRVRIDPRSGQRYTTVELLAEHPDEPLVAAVQRPAPPASGEGADDLVSLKVGLAERQMHRKLKAAGATYDEGTRVWRVRRSQAVSLGLEGRIL
jgi:hypothetical protein